MIIGRYPMENIGLVDNFKVNILERYRTVLTLKEPGLNMGNINLTTLKTRGGYADLKTIIY